MDEQFTYFYPVVIEQQLDFKGHAHPHEVLLDGHIVHNEVLMCKESRERLLRINKAEKAKKVSLRVPYTRICPVCLEAWKQHPDSPYYKFTHGKPTKLVSKEVPVVG